MMRGLGQCGFCEKPATKIVRQVMETMPDMQTGAPRFVPGKKWHLCADCKPDLPLKIPLPDEILRDAEEVIAGLAAKSVIKEISVIRLQPNDVLCVKFERHLCPEARENVRKQFKLAGIDNKILVADEKVEFTTIRPCEQQLEADGGGFLVPKAISDRIAQYQAGKLDADECRKLEGLIADPRTFDVMRACLALQQQE